MQNLLLALLGVMGAVVIISLVLFYLTYKKIKAIKAEMSILEIGGNREEEKAVYETMAQYHEDVKNEFKELNEKINGIKDEVERIDVNPDFSDIKEKLDTIEEIIEDQYDEKINK